MAETIGYEPCRCGCRPVNSAPGCPCPECQPGPGNKPKIGLRDIMNAAGVDVYEPHYCRSCNNIVLVLSIERDDHWTHICKPRAHGWRTEGRI